MSLTSKFKKAAWGLGLAKDTVINAVDTFICYERVVKAVDDGHVDEAKDVVDATNARIDTRKAARQAAKPY